MTDIKCEYLEGNLITVNKHKGPTSEQKNPTGRNGKFIDLINSRQIKATLNKAENEVKVSLAFKEKTHVEGDDAAGHCTVCLSACTVQ